jgi:RNA polymerase sigma-70 factor (ECF subfamily)
MIGRRFSPWPRAQSLEDPSTEMALIARARIDPAAFDALFADYREGVLRYCFYRLGTWDDAEDAAQEVLIRVAANLDRFVAGRASFKTWVFAIAHNETIDVQRRRLRSRDVPLSEAAPWHDPAPSPEDAAMQASDQAYCRSLFSLLPDDQRAVVELRAADLTTSEIAAVLGKREEHVRKLQERALTRLRTAMAAERDTGGAAVTRATGGSRG